MFGEEFANYAANKALRKLGVNETPRKTYAFDGILEGKDYVPFGNDNGFLKVSSDTPDFRKAEKIDTWYGVATPTTPGISIIEGTAENNELFGAKGYIFMIDRDPAMVVVTDTLNSPIPSTGLYFFCGYYPENTTMLVNELVIAETITPIDQKYLPGVCLPVVELSTVVTEEGAELTAEESALMDKVAAMDVPIVAKMHLLSTENTTQLLMSRTTEAGFLVFNGLSIGGYVYITNQSGAWTMAVEGIA